jgi:hypothetical protein
MAVAMVHPKKRISDPLWHSVQPRRCSLWSDESTREVILAGEGRVSPVNGEGAARLTWEMLFGL